MGLPLSDAKHLFFAATACQMGVINRSSLKMWKNVTEGTGIANDQRFFEPAHEQGGDRICIDFWLEYMLAVEQLGQSR